MRDFIATHPDPDWRDAATRFEWFAPQPCRRVAVDVDATTAARLEQPSSGPPLAELLRGDVLLVVPDATRATGVRAMVGAIDAHLAACGVDPARCGVLVAGGLHRPPTGTELELLIGADRGAHATVHDAHAMTALESCGTTRRGTPIHLNRRVMTADRVVLVGGITGHYFTGFTGGAKGILPGAAGNDTILANHRLAVAPGAPRGLHPACGEGRIDGNPVFADLVEGAAVAPHVFLVNAVSGPGGLIVDIVTGDVGGAHAHGVGVAREACALPSAAADLVYVTTGEPGRQRDWIQAHKVLRQGAACARDGGVVVAELACPDGVGSATLEQWMRVPNRELVDRVSARYDAHGHTALAMRALTARLCVVLVSELDPALVRSFGMLPAPDPAAAMQVAAAEAGGGAALRIDHAGALLPAAAGA